LSAEQAVSPDAATILSLFEADYAKLFGRVVDGMEVEITVWSVNAYTSTETPAPLAPPETRDEATTSGTRALFDPALGQRVEAAEIRRSDMSTGAQAQGPAVVTENETTVIVPSSRAVLAHADGTLDVYAKEA
jgi:N-methylhydantoinase A